MPCRKLTRLRTVIWVVFLVVSALVAFQKNVFKKKVVKVQSKNLGYPNTIRFSSARINASKSRSFEVTDLLKTKETAKHLHSSEINTKQDYVIQASCSMNVIKAMNKFVLKVLLLFSFFNVMVVKYISPKCINKIF